MPYDVGAITRELQDAFRLFVRDTTVPPVERVDAINLNFVEPDDGGNLATPENMMELLLLLQRFTNELRAERTRLGAEFSAGQIATVVAIGPAGILLTQDSAIPLWDDRMEKWEERLGNYIDETEKAPPGDRQDILWSVTAPLLLGFFGGPNSDDPQRPLDAITPFSLANQLQVTEAWRDERWELFKSDLAEGAATIADAVTRPIGLLLPAVVVGALLGIFLLRR